MRNRKNCRWQWMALVTGLWLVVLMAAPFHVAPAQSGHPLLGGPRGAVRASTGAPLEGIMVQFVSEKSAVRTTVYSNEDGRFEFPKMDAGLYTLRIARPLEFKPYRKDSLQIDGATQLEEIVLERITDSEFLPPTPEIAEQLTGTEWMMNIPGTGEEKKTLTNNCGTGGCHTWRQLFNDRFDEAGWKALLNRMMRTGPIGAAANMSGGFSRGGTPYEFELLGKFLARVRGPGAKDSPFKVLPRARGAATRVIITEYELPHLRLFPHDAWGDSEGYLWYSSHRAPYIGKLDPRTGKVTEYRVPGTPGAHPGTHWIRWDDKRKVIWLTQNWAHQIIKFDPRTEQFAITRLPNLDVPLNRPMGGNWGLHPDGSLWATKWGGGQGAVLKVDPETGKFLKEYPLQKIHDTYGSAVSADGKFWCGGGSPEDAVACVNIETDEVIEMETSPGAIPARGAFDLENNSWWGGRGGSLIKADPKKRRITEYLPPTSYLAFYEAAADNNGEIWAGELHGGRFVRFNPRTERWIEYVMPTPDVRNRKTWIDHSTKPVTVWYVDHDGRLVRIQPLE
ncbi:MAG: hypothetical protein A3J28_06630 [Acidobacteria bacterium RIFCSPLOWO2_12_FULL_60_22]|nr:MAG: hypothetical protein A3J28_06630 [Acidobacteria bacterium RIFCSPLOWO2_12_FULL_60_22]